MYFARFAKKEEGQCNLLAWFAVQEFKTVPAECLEFRQHKAREIVRKYVTVGARSSGNTAVGEELAAADRAALENLVLLSGERLLVPSDEPEELPSNAFDPLEEAAVTALSGEFFARFKETEEHEAYRRARERWSSRSEVQSGDLCAAAPPPPPRATLARPRLSACPARRSAVIRNIDEGEFGTVLHVRKRSTGQDLALKVQRKAFLIDESERSSKKKGVLHERNALATCTHPFVVSGLRLSDESHVFLATGLLRGGTLEHIITRGGVPEAEARFYLVEIALALKHIHDQLHTHRDLKPQNVMLDRDGHVQLIDLGLAALSNHDINAQVASRHNSIVGAVGYQAPEMLFVDKLAKGYSYSVDWWSLGVVAFELLVGRHPFGHAKGVTLVGGGEDGASNAALANELYIPPSLSPSATALVRAFIAPSVSHRLGCGRKGRSDLAAVRAHPFFADVDWEIALSKGLPPPWAPAYGAYDVPPSSDLSVARAIQEWETRFSPTAYGGGGETKLEGEAAEALRAVGLHPPGGAQARGRGDPGGNRHRGNGRGGHGGGEERGCGLLRCELRAESDIGLNRPTRCAPHHNAYTRENGAPHVGTRSLTESWALDRQRGPRR